MENILVDAKTLKNNSTQKRYIEEIIHDIILKINSELKLARKNGEHYIISEIPIIFDIPNMTTKDAQRSIWAQTIDILRKKNYIVYINHTKNSCRLKITWLAADDEAKIQNQMDILRTCSATF